MPNQEEEAPSTADGALELNKESIQDLDIESLASGATMNGATDAENVKGGIGGSIRCAVPRAYTNPGW